MNAWPPDLLESLRAYSSPFAVHPPAIVSRFKKGGDPAFSFEIESDRGIGILLMCAALYKPAGEATAQKIMSGLYEKTGNDIFKLNRLPVSVFEEALGALKTEEQKRIPGILRSVCDFFYKIGALGPWLESTGDWEGLTGELSQEIYWMGKHSHLRTKSRYFFWLLSFQPGFAARFPQASNFDWPVTEGHLRFHHNILPANAKQSLANPAARLHVFSQLAREVFPGKPWKAHQPLDAYLRPEKEHDYLCRKVQGGCHPCPLRKFCPASKFFTR